MNIPPDLSEPGTDTIQHAVRLHRLQQITTLLICGFAVGSLQFSLSADWEFAAMMGVAMTLLLVCHWLVRRGALEWGGIMVLLILLVTGFAFTWEAEGLYDEFLLGVPVLLVITGLTASKKHFFGVLITILLFLAVLYYATQAGWREDEPHVGGPNRLINIELILLVGAVLIWLIIDDMQVALANLRTRIAAYHASEVRLTYLSRHDALTGLPNRVHGTQLIRQALLHASATRERVALLLLDIDHFKIVNETLGHLAGDRFLVQMAERLTAACRAGDIVCRLGGDEFLIGISNVTDLSLVTEIANRLAGSISEPLVDQNTEVVPSCSIGIALFPDDGNDLDSLQSRADLAMTAAKRTGRNAVLFYDVSMQARAQQDLRLISGLRQGLQRGEFELLYQPVYRLSSMEIVSVEALVRWNHPDGGSLMPADFIGVAEKSGLIHELGAWILQQACSQMVAWQRAGRAPAHMAVNLSIVQLQRGNLVELVRRTLERTGLAGQFLELELTESTAVADTERVIEILHGLKALGARLAIDDFGTGYSNLSYLQRFNADKLKIDQSFVKRLRTGRQERAIVATIIQLAGSLGLKTVAEGIEDQAVRDLLIELGCDEGQGYLFARPCSAAELVPLL